MQKRIDSFRYAINGFRLVLKTEFNMRIHVLAAILVIGAGIIFAIDKIEWMLIILCIAIVWAAEIGNTIVEKYLNVYHPEINHSVGAIKDMSAATVLVLSLAAALIGALIFIPKILEYV